MAAASSSRWAVLLLSLGILFVDQITKQWIRARLQVGAQVPVIPGFFNLSHVLNEGAAWGLLQGLGRWLIAFSLAVLFVLVATHRVMTQHSRLALVASSFLFGGIVGNLIDRVRLGYVVDFLDFHWRGWHFPSFNVADTAICFGVGLYLLSQRSPASSHSQQGHGMGRPPGGKTESSSERSTV